MKDALDELLDRYAPDAGAMWLAAETPDIVPEHPFSPKFRRRMDRLIRRQGRSPAVTAALRCARRAAAYALVLPILLLLDDGGHLLPGAGAPGGGGGAPGVY